MPIVTNQQLSANTSYQPTTQIQEFHQTVTTPLVTKQQRLICNQPTNQWKYESQEYKRIIQLRHCITSTNNTNTLLVTNIQHRTYSRSTIHTNTRVQLNCHAEPLVTKQQHSALHVSTILSSNYSVTTKQATPGCDCVCNNCLHTRVPSNCHAAPLLTKQHCCTTIQDYHQTAKLPN